MGSALTQRKFNPFIVNVVPMTNEDERALSIARPNVGYRINVDGQMMTIWELWARFRSELVDGGTAAYHLAWRREQGAPSARAATIPANRG
jgi:hypothetical protein